MSSEKRHYVNMLLKPLRAHSSNRQALTVICQEYLICRFKPQIESFEDVLLERAPENEEEVRTMIERAREWAGPLIATAVNDFSTDDHTHYSVAVGENELRAELTHQLMSIVLAGAGETFTREFRVRRSF